MASGSFNLTRSSGSSYLTFPVEWSSTSNGTVANSSTVRVKVYVSKSSSSTAATYGSANTTATVGGSRQSNNGFSFSVSPGGKVLLLDKTYTVAHNVDGSKSVAISVTVGGNIMGASGSTTAILDAIPRAASITSAPEFTDEENPTITYSNPAGDSVDSLQACISLTGALDDVRYRDIPKTGSSYTFELTEDERNVLRNATLSDKTYRTVYFFVATTIDGTIYRKRSDGKTFTVVDCAPTLSPTVIDIGSRSTVLTGDPNVVIKGFNTMQVSSGAAALKGASITSQTVTCGSKVIESGNGKLGYVDSPTFVFRVTDNRGQTVEKTVTKDFVDYKALTCGLNINAPDADGDLKFTIKGNYFDGSFGAVENVLAVEYRYKTNDGDYPTNDNGEYIWTAATPVITGNTYSAEVTISGLDYQSTYTFQARAADQIKYGYINTAERTVKTTPVFDWGENDFNFNVPVAAPELTVNGRKYGENKILWTGGHYMNANQSATLNEAISAQPNGIVLVFSLYDSTNETPVRDVSINTFFVSKKEVELLPGAPHTFIMGINAGFSKIGAKYLYINDTVIVGHEGNVASGTNSGITFNNGNYVLRYVIGV